MFYVLRDNTPWTNSPFNFISADAVLLLFLGISNSGRRLLSVEGNQQ
jgi:hypothetical protein